MKLGIDVATGYIGCNETDDKKELMDFFKANAQNNDIVMDPTTVSWCAAFVNACEREVGNKGTGHLNAQSFRTYGNPVDLDTIRRGDIIVLHFPTTQDWQGHVTYYDSQDIHGNLKCLGGNQSNNVQYSYYSPKRIQAIRRV